MTILLWIIGSTIAMSLISLVGAVSLIFKENLLKKIIFPLVAFSAGALLGGAFFHLLPEAIEEAGPGIGVFVWLVIGYSAFFMLEQFINWHHCHKMPSEHKHPVTYLILVSDAVHNFIDGLAIASAFIVDIRLGIVTWFAAAAHEVPQELGDFGILIHGGWKAKQALIFNFLSALAMVLGGLTAYFISTQINIIYLLVFAAGSFIYIASSDLIPEIKHREKIRDNVIHFIAFATGIILLWAIRYIE